MTPLRLNSREPRTILTDVEAPQRKATWLAACGLPAALLVASLMPAAQQRPAAQKRQQSNQPPAQRTTVEQIRSYFTTCDRDGNGWISYREANESLGLDRETYGRFDTDEPPDGRVSFEEFQAGYEWIADQVDYLPRPHPTRSEIVDLPRDPLAILTAYDTSADGALDQDELEVLLFDYGRSEIPASLALERLDDDADGLLRDSELELLSRLIATLHVAGPDAGPRRAPPTSVSELFGRAVPRSGDLDRSRQPPLIVGPVPVFRRLDLDDDGGIEVQDLEELLSPLQLGLSLPAIHATIDLDEDGRIEPDELALALGARR